MLATWTLAKHKTQRGSGGTLAPVVCRLVAVLLAALLYTLPAAGSG